MFFRNCGSAAYCGIDPAAAVSRMAKKQSRIRKENPYREDTVLPIIIIFAFFCRKDAHDQKRAHLLRNIVKIRLYIFPNAKNYRGGHWNVSKQKNTAHQNCSRSTLTIPTCSHAAVLKSCFAVHIVPAAAALLLPAVPRSSIRLTPGARRASAK